MVRMNKDIFLVLLVFVTMCTAKISTVPIGSGYGDHGSWDMKVDSIANPNWRGHSVYLFYPSGSTGTVPVYFFCHGIGADDPHVYYQLIEHCVSQGCAVLYSPFSKKIAFRSPHKTYKVLWGGFEAGVKTWRAIIDTNRIGFLGHSYGGGAVPSLTYKAIQERHWGKNGAFMYIMAPWYVYEITQEQLTGFPSNVKLVMEIFDEDRINDHRIAVDIFNSISISSSEKDFITLQSDTCEKEILHAGHTVPEGTYPYGWDVNALDYYGVYRIVDALADYTFNGNGDAKNIALGNGSDTQRSMGTWRNGSRIKELLGSDTPEVKYPQTLFINFWNHAINPRAMVQHYFDTALGHSYSTPITIHNYESHFVYPGKSKRKTEEYLEDQGIKPIDKDVENDDYKDDGDYKVTVPDSIDDKDLWPIAPITEGFGANGKYTVTQTFLPHPRGAFGSLYCFTPNNYNGRMPVILFAPALGNDGDGYRQLLIHIASQGYKVIASSYRYRMFTKNEKRYESLMAGFEEVLQTEKQYIDTIRIGFVGHSYGASALLAVSWYYLKKKQWGTNGAFLFMMSPSYVYCFTDKQFAHFPSWVNLVIQIYEEDHCNDYRIAEDIFYSMNIDPSHKDFLCVRECAHGDFSYDADYQLPMCNDVHELKPLHQYGIFRQLDALAAHTFINDSQATCIALGNGSAEQIFMGKWWDGTPVRPLISTDVPVFRNLRWLRQGMLLGIPSLISKIWSVSLLCNFHDKRNKRRDKPVP